VVAEIHRTDVKGIPPLVTPETAAFWANAAEDRLVVDRCTVCVEHYFPPRGWCAGCGTAETIDPEHELSGPARLYSFTINHKPWIPGMAVPFVLGLAHFDHAPGVRIPCRVRARDAARIACDSLLEVGFEPGPAGFAIPSFTML
jgi:uncharacterized OB-fold protein